MSIDATLRHVSKLRALNVQAYSAFDVAVGWRPRRELEVSLVGQNLFDCRHPEQAQCGVIPNAIGTGGPAWGYAKLNWKF